MGESLMQVLDAHILAPLESLHGFDVIDKVRIALDQLLNLLGRDIIFELGQQYVL